MLNDNSIFSDVTQHLLINRILYVFILDFKFEFLA
jgi:hypothetical protein